MKGCLKDVISAFEEHGWDWTYHVFREWPVWSVEHEGEGDDTPDNPRRCVLVEAFRRR